MANTTIALRSSGVTGNVPSLGVIANGELSLNFADGIIYYKTASNTLGSIRTTQPAGLTTEIQFNDAGSFGSNASLTFNKSTGTLNVTNINTTTNLTANNITTGNGAGGVISGANVIYSNNFVANTGGNSTFNGGAYFNNTILIQNGSGAGGGSEGGELQLAIPPSNTSLSGPISIDIYENKLRIFESTGTNRGVYVDLSSTSAGVGTNLIGGGVSGVSSVAGASGSVSNNQILSGILTVDGSGSGLDADLWDGNNFATYLNQPLLTTSQVQFDTVYSANNGLGQNFKVGDDVWIGDTNIANTLRIKGQQDAANGYIIFGNNDGKLLGRSGSGPLTYDSQTIWHAGNDGSGSGLDADLLDGYNIGTSGSTIPLLNGINTWSGNNTFSGSLFNITGDEIRNSGGYIQRFTRNYSFSSYLTSGETQKVLTIIPNGSSQNYSIYGKVYLATGDNVQILDIQCNLRSNTLPDLAWEIYYDEDLNGITTGYVKPVLWTKETTTAGFILGLEYLSGGTVQQATVDLIVVNRSTSYTSNITLYTGGEVSVIDTDYTNNYFTLRRQRIGSSSDKSFLPLYKDGNIVWHAGNDGTGSGLDADLLDGQHASYYSTNTYAISAYTQANTANTNAVNAGTYANAAFAQANTANTRAYATVLKTGDTISGDLVIEGNLTIQGSQFITDTTTLAVSDNMIYLNNPISANITNAVGNGSYVVYTTDAVHGYEVGLFVFVTGITPSAYNISSTANTLITSVTSNTFTVASNATGTYVSGGVARARSGMNPDIGFAAGYNDGTYHHAGLFRDATDGIWKFFDNYTPEPDDSIFINTSDVTFRIANLTANLVTQSVIVTGDNSTSNITGAIKVTGGIGVVGNVSADSFIFPDGTSQNTAAGKYNTSLIFTKANGTTANMALRVADTQLTSALNSVYVPFLLADGTTAKNLYVSN